MSRSESNIELATIVITGATDGIGQALARHYAGTTYQGRPVRLVLIGRRPLDQLDDPLYTPDTYCRVDLADAECAAQVDAWLAEHAVETIDVLVHNAGVGFVGRVTRQQPDSVRRMIAVNLVAPIALTHRLLPRMNPQQGRLVYISSVVSALPAPQYAVYAATKAALDGFVRNLQIELAASPATRGITAQLIRPGATRTGMHAKSGATRDRMDWEKYTPAESVAAQIARAINGRQRAVTLGAMNRVLRAFGIHAVDPLDRLLRLGARRRYGDELSDSPPPATTAQSRCVITGAADGIGRALAQEYAAVGYAVTGLDVDATRAAQTASELRETGGDVGFLLGDLADADDLARLQRQLLAGPPISVLVHSAGINAVGPFATSDLARQLRVIDVNFTAPLLLTIELLCRDAITPGGTLIFLSSLSHFASYPGAAVYAATKDGLASFARSLSVTLAPQRIHVLTVFPGPTRTAHARRYSPDNSREHRRMPPEEVAARIFNAARGGKHRLVPGWGNRTFAMIGRFFPRLTEQIMRRTLLDKMTTPR